MKHRGYAVPAIHLWAKEPFFKRCLEVSAEDGATPFLLLGDLNTGNQITDKEPE
jgi:hypothetical protein